MTESSQNSGRDSSRIETRTRARSKAGARATARAAALLLLVSFVAGPGVALANDPPEAASKKLSARQRQALERYQQFEKALYRLQVVLTKLDPEKAARIRLAYDAARESLILDNMARIKELVKAGDLDEALRLEMEVKKDLKSLRELLRKVAEEERKKVDRERLKKLKKKLEKLIKEQRELKNASKKATDLDRRAKALAEAAKEVSELIAKQKALMAKTEGMKKGASKGEFDEKAKAQDQIAKKTNEIEGRVKGALKGAPGQGEGEGKPGGSSKPGMPMMPGQNKSGSPTHQLSKAKSEMDKAGQKLDKLEKKKSLERMKKALDRLEKAKEALEKKRRRLLELANLDKLSKQQEALKNRTKQLGKEMSKSGQKGGGQKGGGQQPPGGQKGGQKPPGGQKGGGQKKQAPGKRRIIQAQQHQKKAGDNLFKKKPAEAEEQQQKAIDELEKAKEELREALLQARKQEQEAVLRSLGERLMKMLRNQQRITKETIAIDVKRGKTESGKLSRRQRLEVRRLASSAVADTPGEWQLGEEAEDAVEIVEQEGTTVVFPSVLEDLSEDFKLVARRLKKGRTGDLTQSIQTDIEETLKELIEVIKKELENKQGGGGGGGGGGSSEQPLLPNTAELKMIRSLQIRVNRMTKRFHNKRADKLTPEHRDDLKVLEGRQKSVRDLTKDLHRKLNKED